MVADKAAKVGYWSGLEVLLQFAGCRRLACMGWECGVRLKITATSHVLIARPGVTLVPSK